MNQRGFAFAPLLASPTLWLGLGVALLSFSSFMLYKQWVAALEREAKARGEHAAFVAAVKARSAEVEAENAKREEQWRAALAAQRASAARDRAALRADLERMRGKPVDPGGREIPVTAAPGPVADGLPAKLVPLAAYESLQERAAFDALQVTQLQDYISSVCLAR